VTLITLFLRTNKGKKSGVKIVSKKGNIMGKNKGYFRKFTYSGFILMFLHNNSPFFPQLM